MKATKNSKIKYKEGDIVVVLEPDGCVDQLGKIDEVDESDTDLPYCIDGSWCSWHVRLATEIERRAYEDDGATSISEVEYPKVIDDYPIY